MRIGELAKSSGLAQSRIRFYESIGLLRPVERRPNGYRMYPPEAALVLDLITMAQKAGFSLDEIRALLPPDLAKWDHDRLMTTLRRKVDDIESMQRTLARSKADLVALIREIEARPDGIDCSTNALRVMSHLQHGGRKAVSPKALDVRGAREPSRRVPRSKSGK